jgi:hypothetical protein
MMPHSGDFLARFVAARLASALVLESLSSAHVFNVSRAWVTRVSMPLVVTLISPAAVALVGLAVGHMLLPNMRSPTGFLVLSTPLSLS